ncbi:MAG: hypothetical protein JNM62_13205 [Flavobacteriales bacterium]|nr:hypothetical protein [Flavobacteriales bacterium]
MGDHPTKRSVRRRWRWPILFLGSVLVTECVLRLGFGFCDAVLLRPDPNYEYIAQASQDRHRFGRHIVFNSLSMRSEEPDSNAIIILGCGDSVINGGTLTENDSLATTILSAELTAKWGRKVQFLNIGTGSWGPDNCAAYLRNTPLPKASALVLFASSHDARDNMTFSGVVGVKKHFPSEQYPSAILELLDRYVIPRFHTAPGTSDEELGINKGGLTFNSGFAALKAYAERHRIPFMVYLHAERSEIKKAAYNEQGQEIIAFAEQNGIPLIRDLDHGARIDELRDNIHPSDAGQRRLARIMLEALDGMKPSH